MKMFQKLSVSVLVVFAAVTKINDRKMIWKKIGVHQKNETGWKFDESFMVLCFQVRVCDDYHNLLFRYQY